MLDVFHWCSFDGRGIHEHTELSSRSHAAGRALAKVAPPCTFKGVVRLSSYLDVAISELLRLDAPDTPPPVQSTDYDTSWAARLTGPDERPAHPELLEYLAEKQHPDGSWGAEIPHAHDRLLSTLSVILLLAKHGSRQRDREKLRAGEHYLWQSIMWLRHDPQRTVGFEMILPTLLAEARELGLHIPYSLLAHYERERAEKLALFPRDRLFDTQTSALFSLEAFAGEVDTSRLSRLLLDGGSMATSPSATAFLLNQHRDWRVRFPKSAEYLDGLLSTNGSGLPPIAPYDVFMRAWTLYHLSYSNILEKHRDAAKPHYGHLLRSLREDGVGWASEGLADSDDTAVTLQVLAGAGYETDGSVLLRYEREKYFAVLEYEWNPSVSANLHILEALATIPEKDQPRVQDKILRYVLGARQNGAFWSDKWHASAYYPTAIALLVLPHYLPDTLQDTVKWILATQRVDGSWGQYRPTVEETAITLLALLNYHRNVRELPRNTLHKAAAYLLANERPFEDHYPELWVSKTLYAPTMVIRSATLGALGLYLDTFPEP
jgi:halimadienyl-diphosphate synthase